jgi:hypothetical protein
VFLNIHYMNLARGALLSVDPLVAATGDRLEGETVAEKDTAVSP